jgi:ribokinase
MNDTIVKSEGAAVSESLGESLGQVVVVGSTNWDIAMYLPSLPRPGETVASGRLQTGLGGKGANQAVAAHRAGGVDTVFLSCVGDDDIAESVRQVFTSLEMAIPYVAEVAGTGTGSACIFVNAEGENCIGVASGANTAVDPAFVHAHEVLINGAQIVLAQLEIPLSSVEALAEMCAKSTAIFVLNPAPAVPLPDALLARVDVLTPNEGELAQLSGMPVTDDVALQSAARSLCDKGVGTVIVTLGSRGCLIVTASSAEFVVGLTVEAVDTTAAGDVFNGALVAEMIRGQSLSTAAVTACKAAALAVMSRGAIASIPTRQQVLAFAPRHFDSETSASQAGH